MFPLTLSDCKSYLNSFKILLILRALKSPLLNTKRVHSMGPSFFAQLSKSFIYIFVTKYWKNCILIKKDFIWKNSHTIHFLICYIMITRFSQLSTELSVVFFGLFFARLDSEKSILRIMYLTIPISLVYIMIQV